MTSKSTVKDIDRGWNAIVKNLQTLNSLDVFVGIHEGIDHDGELTAAQVGAIHEFGSKDGRIPQRRWLRAGVDYYAKEIGQKYDDAFKASLKPGSNMRRELNRIGLFGAAKVKEYIRKVGQSVWPDITDETKLAKGSTKILIGKTSQLINSVKHTLRPAGQKRDEGTRLSDADGTTVIATAARAKRSIGQIRSERRKASKARRSEKKAATRTRRKEATKRRTFAAKLRKDDRRDKSRAKKREATKRRSFMSKMRKSSRKEATRAKNTESRKRRLFISKLRKDDRRDRSRVKIREQKLASRDRVKARNKAKNTRDRAKIRERNKKIKVRATVRAKSLREKDKVRKVSSRDRVKKSKPRKTTKTKAIDATARAQAAFSGK